MRKFVTSGAIFFALSTSVGADTGKKTFIALDGCQRTYVQQLLSDKGVYSSGIDGLWGKGTAKALAQYSKGQSTEKVLKELSNKQACKKNPDRLKYSKFVYKKSTKGFVLTVPDVSVVPSKYDDLPIAGIWTREWLDEYAACYGIKMENLNANHEYNIEWNDKTGDMSATIKIMGSC